MGLDFHIVAVPHGTIPATVHHCPPPDGMPREWFPFEWHYSRNDWGEFSAFLAAVPFAFDREGNNQAFRIDETVIFSLRDSDAITAAFLSDLESAILTNDLFFQGDF